MRRCGQARRRDQNESSLVEALERFGAQVFRLSGKGVPDLLVYFRGMWLPMEVKTSRGTLTDAQQSPTFERVPIVRTIDDVRACLAAMSRSGNLHP